MITLVIWPPETIAVPAAPVPPPPENDTVAVPLAPYPEPPLVTSTDTVPVAKVLTEQMAVAVVPDGGAEIVIVGGLV